MNRFFALGCSVLVAAFALSCCIPTTSAQQWTTSAPTISPPFSASSVAVPGGVPSSTGPFYPGYDNSTCTPSWNATIPTCNGTTSTGPFYSAEWNTTSCQYQCQPYTCYSHLSCLANPSSYGCDGVGSQCSSTLYTQYNSWTGARYTQCYTSCAYLPMCEPSYNTTIPTCSYGGGGENFTIDSNGTMVAIGPKWNTTSCQYECQNITCPDQDRCQRENWCAGASNPSYQCVTRLNFYQRDYRRSWKSSVCSTGCEPIPLPPLANDTCIPSWNTTIQNSTNAWNTSVTIIPNCNSSTSGPFQGLEWNTTSCQYECQSIECPSHQRCEQQGWCNYNNYYTGRPQMCSTQVYTVGAYQRPWLTSQCSTGCVDRPYNLTCKPDANTPLPSCATNATQTSNGTWVASGAEWNTTSCQYECRDKICSQESCERDNWCGSVPGASCFSQVVTYDTNNWYQPWKTSTCSTGCRYEPVCLPTYNTTFPYNVTCNTALSNTNITNTNGSRVFSANRWNTTTCSYECELLTCPAPTYCYCGFGYTCEASVEYYGYYAPNGTVYIPRCGTTCVFKPRPIGFPTFNPYEERSSLVANNYGYASYANTGNNSTDMDIPYRNQERTYTMWIKSSYNYYYYSDQVFFGMSTNNASQDSAYSCWYTNTSNTAAADDYLVIGRTYSGEIFVRTCRNYITISSADFGGLYQSQWYHIAFVYRPTSRTAQLFVNGYTNGPQSWFYDINTSRERVVLGMNPLMVNNYNYDYYSKFQGEIGRINFYRFALTSEAIYSDVTYGSVSTPASRLGPVTYNGLPQYGNLNKNLNQTFTLYGSYVYLTWNETIWSPNATCTPSWNATIPICNSSSTGPFYSTEWNTTSCQYECQPFTCYSHQQCLNNPSWYGCDGETYQCSSTLSIQYNSYTGTRYTQCSTGCAYLPMCEPSYNETIPTCSYGGSGSNFTINDNGTMIGTGPKWNTTSCRYECQNITCPDQDRCERENWCSGYGTNPSYQCVTRLNFYQTNYRRSWKSSVCSTGCEVVPVPPLANNTCIPSWNTTVQNTTSWSWNTTVTIIPNCNSSTSGPFQGLEWNTTSCQYECQAISCPSHQRCEQQGWCNYNNYYTGRPQMCSTQVYTTGAYQRPWLTSQCSTGCVDRPYNLTCKPDANTPLPSCANVTRSINGTWVASGAEWNTTSCQYECVDHICSSHQVCERDDWCGSVPGASCSSQIYTYDTNNWYQPWKTSICSTGCRYEPVCLPSNTTTYPYNVTCNNATLSNTNITNTNGSRIFTVNRWNTTTCSYQCEIKTCPKPSYCYCGFGYTCEATIVNSYYGTNSSYVIIPRCSSQCVAIPRPVGFPTFNPYEDRSALVTNGYGYASYANTGNKSSDMDIPYQNQARTITVWIKSYDYYYNYNYYWTPEQVFFGMTSNNASTYSCGYTNTTNTGDEDLVIGRTSYGQFFARTCRNYISISSADFGDLYNYQWIHVAFVYRPSDHTAQLFVNGYTNGPQYWSYGLNTSRERVVLGTNPVANTYYYGSNFNGEIGRINFYRFALTAEAIYSDVTYGVVSIPASRWGPVTYNGFPQYGNLNNRNQTFTLYGSYIRLSWNETSSSSSSSTGGVWPTPTPSSTGANGNTTAYNCSQHTNCLSCVAGPICGWCSTTGRCVAGSGTGSNDGICSRSNTASGPDGTWSWVGAHCSSGSSNTCGIVRGDFVWTGYSAHVFQTKLDCEIVTNGTSETCQPTPFIPQGNVTHYSSCGLHTGDEAGIGCWFAYARYIDYLEQCNNGGGKATWVSQGDGPLIRARLFPTTAPPTTTTRPPTIRPTTTPPTQVPTTAAPTTPAPAVPTTFNWTSLTERTWSHPFKSSISFVYNNPPRNIPLYVRVQGRSTLITQGTTSSSIQVSADVNLKGNQQLTSMTVEILRDDEDGTPIAADHIYTQVVTRSAISRVAIPEPILNAMANGEDANVAIQPCPPTANTGAIVGGVVAAMTALIILSNIATHIITKRHQQKVQSAPAPASVTETWQANPAVAGTEGVIVVV